jgi:hypothetical protein
MARRVSRRRLVYATLLAALAVLPNVVHVYGGVMYFPARDAWVYRPSPEPNDPVVRVFFIEHLVFQAKVPSVERARSIGYRWEKYRSYWWIFAAAAGCVVLWAVLPIPRLFGPDDDESCD